MNRLAHALAILALAALLFPAGASADTCEDPARLDWPFSVKHVDRLKLVRQDMGAELWAVPKKQRGSLFAVAQVPLDFDDLTTLELADVATSGAGIAKFEEGRRTDDRVHLSRGTEWAAFMYSADAGSYPTQAVAELAEGCLNVFYKVELKIAWGARRGKYRDLLGEPVEWVRMLR